MSFEEWLESKGEDFAKEFWADCSFTFSAGAGRRVLETLIKFAHPLHSPLRATAEQTAAQIGRQEMTAALWRRSASQLKPEPTPTTE